jgi:outer membrane protein insertion porin family
MTPSAAEAAVASSIVVSGNTRIEASTIINYVLIKPGQSYTAFDVDESVKALFDTGLFADVTIRQSGSRLVVTVVENPLVNTVIFSGNKKVKSEILVQLAETRSRGVLTDAKLQGDVQRIEDYYATQGRSSVTVTADVTQLPDNRVDVVFTIVEGRRTGVGSIDFVGNSHYSNQKLRSVITTKRHNWLSWLNRKDIFDEGKLAADEEALRRFYMSHGFADFRVISVDHSFDEARGRYHVVFTIEEGARYRFSTVSVDSTIPGVDGPSLMRYVKTRPGRVFNAALVEKTIEDLTIAVSSQGYAFAQIRPRGDRDYENNSIAITYLVDEGPRVYIERINIVGNTKTRDYVIRREFTVSEGDPYNRVLIDSAERKLRDLGFFKTVAITTEPGSGPDRVVVNVMVEDDRTGEFSVGGGISTSGLIAEVSLDEKNFLGRGQHLRIAVGYGENEQSYNISFTDPYFLGYRISAGVDAYLSGTNAISWRPFNSETIGGGLRFGVPITDNLQVLLNYKLFEQTVSGSGSGVAGGCVANPQICAYFPNGSTLTSMAGYGIVYSTLDSQLDPRDGFFLQFNQEFAGLGGDTQYMRSIIDARYYHELWSDADIVGLVRATAGNITGLGQKVRPLDNFYKGGETVRGFAPYGYGPVDTATGVPVGGKNFWAATAEVQFPFPGISPDLGLRAAVFADAGSLFGIDVPTGGGPVTDPSTIRSSVGASILWASPIGTLRGDFAYAITKAPTDKLQWFRFSAGRQF